MITIEDCEAFCEADSASVCELACRESLTMVQAYALAHFASQSAIRSGVPEGAETASRAIVRETV